MGYPVKRVPLFFRKVFSVKMCSRIIYRGCEHVFGLKEKERVLKLKREFKIEERVGEEHIY